MELSTSSISNEIDKSIKEEFSVSQAAIDEIKRRREKGQKPKAISNEEIKKNDPILETYKVLDDAIHGGMGSVWRVHHESWNVDLAMKRPQPRFFAEGSEARKEEFIRECENWINLGLHPNIVSCYYVREIGGVPTIFSEWMDNGSLKDRIRDGSLYEGTEEEVQERILDIAIQTARGLQYSHENNLIHQDVKPGNILLTKDWDAKVADFGLAKAQSQLTENKKPVSTGYTIQYCPREQAEGAPAEKWMDVYAWALTVLEMYAGKRLWDTGAEAKEHLEEIFQQFRIGAGEAIQKLLLDCLAANIYNFTDIQENLCEIYKDRCRSEYPREESSSVSDTAASLNNRALSFLDLGMPKMAETFWERALEVEPNHVDALFNRELYLLRNGRKFDFEVIRDLENNSATKETSAAEAIRRECRNPNPIISVDEQNSDYSYLHNLLNGKENLDENVIKITRCPDINRAAILTNLTEESVDLALYNLRENQLIWTDTLPLHGHGKVGQENSLYFDYSTDYSTLVFLSPDGHLCVFLDAETLTVLSESEIQTKFEQVKFFLHLPDNDILLLSYRGLNLRYPDTLYLLGRNTPLKEVFWFRYPDGLRDQAFIEGCSCQDSVIIWGADEKGHRFQLNDQFRQVEDDDSAYTQAMKSAFFVDKERSLMYSRISKSDRALNLNENYHCVCDMKQKRCLYSVPPAGKFLGAVQDQEKNCQLVFSSSDTTLAVLKSEIPDEKGKAAWRVSHIITVQARLEEEERLFELQEQFYSAINGKQYADAVSVLYECRNIPGFSVGENCYRMEYMLEPVAERTRITGVYRINTLKKLPEYAVTQLVYKKNESRSTQPLSNRYLDKFVISRLPTYTESQGWATMPQMTLCSDGRVVVLGNAFIKQGQRFKGYKKQVQIYSPEWELIKTFRLPSYVVKAFVRNDLVHAVTRLLDCAVYNLEGELVRPSNYENFFGSIPVQEKNHYERSRIVEVFDMSIDGNQILFRVKGEDFFDPHSIYPNDEAFYHKDLVTGNLLRLLESKKFIPAYVAYLCDGTILQYGDTALTGLSPTGNRLLRRNPCDGSILWTYPLEVDSRFLDIRFNFFILNETRDRFLVKMYDSEGFDIYCYQYCLFHMDGTLLQKGEITGAGDDFSLPDGHMLRFLRNGNLYDMINDSEITMRETDHINLLDAAFRPDGREMYIKVTGTSETWNQYHLEYEYRLKEEAELSFSENDKLSSLPEADEKEPDEKQETRSEEKAEEKPKKGFFARLFGK